MELFVTWVVSTDLKELVALMKLDVERDEEDPEIWSTNVGIVREISWLPSETV